MIILVALVQMTLAQLQLRLPKGAVVVRGGAFSPAYSPAQMPNIEVATKGGSSTRGGSGYDNRAVAPSVASNWLSPSPAAPAGGGGSGELSQAALRAMSR